ncbi:quinone oxidoreductase family protein [Vibrio owensii]|uniref:quinone oxidoreductase family protein n=1 Tax=Vibrio owensii TaxID=696485 RepID=UPI0040691262
MKAVLLTQTGGSDKLVYQDVAQPTLKEGQVLVRIHAAPVNLIDTIIREGKMPPGLMPELPIVCGVEASGVVVDSNNTELVEGTKVAFLGTIGSATYAEFTAVSADKLIVIPDSIDLQEAAVIPVNYGTAFHMLHNVARVEEGKTALVYAASGGVGTALIQLAKLAGLNVIALERREHKAENAIKLGADFAFTLNTDWVTSVKEVTDGRGVDYIFNPVAGDTIVEDLEVLAPLGHVVIFGILAGIGDTNLQAEAIKHFTKAPTITYSEIYATYFNNYPLLKSALEALYELLEQGKIKPVFTTLPLSEAAQAHDKIESGSVMGKMLLLP